MQAEGLKLMQRHPDAGSVIVLRRIVEKIQRKDDCPVIVSDPLVAAIAVIPGEDSENLLVDCAVSSQYRLIDAAVTALKKRRVEAPADRLARRIADEDSDFFRDKLREVYASLVDAAELGTAAETASGDDEDSHAEESRYDGMQKLREEIVQMSDDEVIAYARSEDDFRSIDSAAFQRLANIESAESSLQLRRFLKSPLIYNRYCAGNAQHAHHETDYRAASPFPPGMASCSAAMYSGPIPQQPPIMLAP